MELIEAVRRPSTYIVHATRMLSAWQRTDDSTHTCCNICSREGTVAKYSRADTHAWLCVWCDWCARNHEPLVALDTVIRGTLQLIPHLVSVACTQAYAALTIMVVRDRVNTKTVTRKYRTHADVCNCCARVPCNVYVYMEYQIFVCDYCMRGVNTHVRDALEMISVCDDAISSMTLLDACVVVKQMLVRSYVRELCNLRTLST